MISLQEEAHSMQMVSFNSDENGVHISLPVSMDMTEGSCSPMLDMLKTQKFRIQLIFVHLLIS